MTAAEREAAVEALRCAADLHMHGGMSRFSYSETMTVADHPDPRSFGHATFQTMHQIIGVIGACGYSWPDAALEAAALLEDGWNPGDPVYRLEDPGAGYPVERRG